MEAAEEIVVPEDLPKEACKGKVKGKRCWTETGLHGGYITVRLDQKAFYILKKGDGDAAVDLKGKRHVAWAKHGGAAKAWDHAKQLAAF